jgi:hypothetical protein
MPSSSLPVPEAYFKQMMGEVGRKPKIDSLYDTLFRRSQLSAAGGNWDWDWELLDSEALIAGTSLPTTPLSLSPINGNQEDNVREQVLEAFHKLYGPDARPKSQEQLELCEVVIRKSFNVIAILPTGAKKSAAWLVPAVVLPHITTIVVVPFERLLSQHLQSAQDLGVHTIQWNTKCGTDIPDGANVLFMAVESFKLPAFSQ